MTEAHEAQSKAKLRATLKKLKLPKPLTDTILAQNWDSHLNNKWVKTVLSKSKHLESNMQDFVKRLQKDLGHLQKTLEKEGNDLVKKVKNAANKRDLVAKGKDLEKLVEKKLKEFEPTFNKVVANIRKQAKKAGVDLDVLTHRAKSGITKAKATAKRTIKTKTKSAATRAKRATTKAATKTAAAAKSVNDVVDTTASQVENFTENNS